MKNILICFLLLLSFDVFAPPNCNIYKKGSDCYLACKESEEAINFTQGHYKSQLHFDKAIKLCPTLAYAHMDKGIPYIKRGLFKEWKKLIDKAVEIEPFQYIGYRGWCRLQFLRDYKGAIKDIERLKEIDTGDIGPCVTGEYHLDIALAMAYKQVGNYEKSNIIFQNHFSSGNMIGLFDYYHFGVLQFEMGNYKEARISFEKQIIENDGMGETYYYQALIAEKSNESENVEILLKKAKSYYENGNFRNQDYTEAFDKIYLTDILQKLKEL